MHRCRDVQSYHQYSTSEAYFEGLLVERCHRAPIATKNPVLDVVERVGQSSNHVAHRAEEPWQQKHNFNLNYVRIQSRLQCGFTMPY